jgi:hypothetical protein
VLINLNATHTAVDRPSLNLKSRNFVKHSHVTVFGEGPEGMVIPPPANEEPATTLPWHSRILASFTMYGELSVAHTPEEFALVRTRLQQEWTFDRDFVSQISIRFLNSRLIHYLVQSSEPSLREFSLLIAD